MDRRTSTRLSKFLSLVLRHRPDEYGLRMDSRGFVDFEDLIDVLVAEDILAEDAEDQVMDLVEGSERRRFEVVDGRIRALYGHSARIDLELPEDDPPAVLYHGTTPAKARDAATEGLRPAGRALVHLSSTREEALAVGRRHDDHPILLEIDTAAARERGIAFHQATELIWLCPDLPVEALRIPEIPEAPEVPEAPERPARHERSERPAPRASAPPPPSAPGSHGGVRPIEPDSGGEFKRRTRKKSSRR